MTEGAEEVIPAAQTGVIVFDMSENARAKIESRGVLAPALRLVTECRARGVPIFFTRPMHRADGLDLAVTVPDMDREHKPYAPLGTGRGFDANSPGSMPLREFDVGPGDYDITKHRWSAFYETALDLSLRRRGITTLLVVGGTTHIGVASTVYSARDRDYQIYVARDACHGEQQELDCLLDYIFPQVCHVRTVEEILERLK